MANESSSDTLNGLFKKVYGDLSNLIPDNVELCKRVPFVPQKKRVGESYNQAIVLKSVHGVTYAGSDGDIVTYADLVPQSTKQATII